MLNKKKVLDDYEICQIKFIRNLVEIFNKEKSFILDPTKVILEDLYTSKSRKDLNVSR